MVRNIGISARSRVYLLSALYLTTTNVRYFTVKCKHLSNYESVRKASFELLAISNIDCLQNVKTF